MSQGKTYEMLWDCQFCGTEKLLGKTHRHCPNCGAPQDPDARYYPSDTEKIAVEDHVLVGADKICDSCGALNAGNAEYCGNCGAPLTQAARAKKLAAESRAQGESFSTSGSGDVIQKEFAQEMERVGAKPKKKSGGMNWRVVAIMVVVAVIIVGAIAALTITRETSVIVTDHSWSREIRVEEYNNFTEQSWRDSRPAGDEVSMVAGSCVERQRSTRRVPDGETCRTVRTDNGDGTFSEREQCTTNYREEPVYDDWCTFRGKRWEYERSVETGGNDKDNPSPYWGEVNLNCAGQRSVGCERESGRDEEYRLALKSDDGNNYNCPVERSLWDAANVDQVAQIQVRVVDADAADCTTIELE